jgi:hypothetical protein
MVDKNVEVEFQNVAVWPYKVSSGVTLTTSGVMASNTSMPPPSVPADARWGDGPE